MSDARFEDGADQALRLRAEGEDDLTVISTLLQDAVARTSQIAWMPRRRKFRLLANRFRWERSGLGVPPARSLERVQSVLEIASALRARASGLRPGGDEAVISILAIGFDAKEDGAGDLRLILAGGGEIVLEVECIDVTLVDVTRPYPAKAGAAPVHDLD